MNIILVVLFFTGSALWILGIRWLKNHGVFLNG